VWWGVGRKSGSEGGLVLKVIDYVISGLRAWVTVIRASAGDKGARL